MIHQVSATRIDCSNKPLRDSQLQNDIILTIMHIGKLDLLS